MGIVHENFLGLIWGYAVKLLEEKPLGVGGVGSAEAASRGMFMIMIMFGFRGI
jgi:hypothetical protein